jgi:hypothetical protein
MQAEEEHRAEAAYREAEELRRLVARLGRALADILADAYRGTTQDAPPGDADREAEWVRQVEASDLFDPVWYLCRHQDVLDEWVSPAVHLVRHGNARGLDPGPHFSTSAYLRDHPEAAGGDVPALLHALGTGAAPPVPHGSSEATS